MLFDIETPGIRIYTGTDAIVIAGHLPGVADLQLEVLAEEVLIDGDEGGVNERVPLDYPVNEEHAVIVHSDGKLLAVLPRR